MAFDQTTRNRLQSFVSNARNILSQEFTRQLQADYGMDPKQGTVADVSTLTHLDNSQRQTAQLLRDTLEHYLATTPGKSDKERTKQVLERIIREQAFTVLNRLAALRMAESREFLIESIGKSQSSKGFQLYRQLAGTSHGETGDAYRNYLFSLFDEFSVDLAVLFDRHSIQGRLFPRESALLELLAEINHQEIDALWAEDETIGWIYQYFNSQEERKKMRAESQAPRNSRELAVRNQFFTPRYVVEFLTDNTLGRIWYEMTQGNTALVDSCSYLVRRPTEIFLKPGEQAPDAESTECEALSQEELLQQPVYISHRKLKDPRSIRMLDPACGSMHFGLYAFDLFEQIYLEAWQLEQELGPGAFQREASQQALQTSFSSLEEFRAQIPKLIIENNIHGVDIDPRAVQIAGLSLWQRAQRAWQLQGIKPQQRPVIIKSNIVCAEPMPGDKALLQEFTSQLNPPVLGQLLEVIFDKMLLAGEAGTLLKIEEEIQTAIKDARDQWQSQSGRNSVSDMFQTELDAATPQQKLGFDLRGIDEGTFWDDAEQLILSALSDYASRAESTADQKRLFAEDTAKGFAFIDLCRKRFDVVLMNPPFGAHSSVFNNYARQYYPVGYIDIYATFIDRGLLLLKNEGFLGCLTSRTNFVLSSFEKWRRLVLLSDSKIKTILDLGENVLDNAMVETAAYTIVKDNKCNDIEVFDLRDKHNKEAELESALEIKDFKLMGHDKLKLLPNSVISYMGLQSDMASRETVYVDDCFDVYGGSATGDDTRFVRAFWEVSSPDIGYTPNKKWCFFSKGGEYSLFYASIHLVVNWHRQGEYLGDYLYDKRPRNGYLWGPKSWSFSFMGKPGISWSRKSQKGISFRFLPENCASSDKTCILIPKNENENIHFLGLLNSDYFSEQAKTFATGYGAYEKGTIAKLKLPVIEYKINNEVQQAYLSVKNIYSLFENDPWFESNIKFASNGFESYFSNVNKFAENNLNLFSASMGKINNELSFNKKTDSKSFLEDIFSSFKKEYIVSELLSYVFNARKSSEELFNNKDYEDNLLSIPVRDFICEKGDVVISSDRGQERNLLKLLEFQIKKIISEEDDLNTLSKYILDVPFEDYFNQPRGFFDDHYTLFSKSKRYAPIYWPLQTPSGSYTLWVYYHRLNKQTLYICVNDFLEGPTGKLTQVEQDLHSLKSLSARSSQEEKDLTRLTDLAAELKDFRDELLRLAKFWKPNLNDGVQITAAPLWKLFQHKAWQKKLKDTWGKLEEGDYDWAHLACSIWPERVLRKCHQDRSLAIAHDVEDIFWHEVEVPVKRGAKLTGEMKTEWQPKSLTATELTELINQTITDLK